MSEKIKKVVLKESIGDDNFDLEVVMSDFLSEDFLKEIVYRYEYVFLMAFRREIDDDWQTMFGTARMHTDFLRALNVDCEGEVKEENAIYGQICPTLNGERIASIFLREIPDEENDKEAFLRCVIGSIESNILPEMIVITDGTYTPHYYKT